MYTHTMLDGNKPSYRKAPHHTRGLCCHHRLVHVRPSLIIHTRGPLGDIVLLAAVTAAYLRLSKHALSFSLPPPCPQH